MASFPSRVPSPSHSSLLLDMPSLHHAPLNSHLRLCLRKPSLSSGFLLKGWEVWEAERERCSSSSVHEVIWQWLLLGCSWNKQTPCWWLHRRRRGAKSCVSSDFYQREKTFKYSDPKLSPGSWSHPNSGVLKTVCHSFCGEFLSDLSSLSLWF